MPKFHVLSELIFLLFRWNVEKTKKIIAGMAQMSLLYIETFPSFKRDKNAIFVTQILIFHLMSVKNIYLQKIPTKMVCTLT